VPSFAFKALDAEGRMQSGEMPATSRAEVYQILQTRSLRPVQIRDTAAAVAAKPGLAGARVQAGNLRLSSARLLQFTEELADLLEAGLQLDPALGVIESREEKSAVKDVAAILRQHIREGRSFSAALAQLPTAFSPLYVSMAAAGEAAGSLPQILRKQTEYLNVILDLRRKVAAALVYPSIVFVAGILLLVIFMTVLLPQLTSLLGKTGQQLPWVTRALIAVSSFLGHWWWALALLVVAAIAAHRHWVSTPGGRAEWDRILLRLPMIGPLVKQRFLAQFLHTLSSMASNGVTLLNALGLAISATGNTAIRAVLQGITAQVAEGASLSRCMKKSGFFPPTLIDIVAVGEQTGDIALALNRGAVKYDREFTHRMQQVTALIQPFTILVIALFVGIVAYSMISGILASVSSLRVR